MTAVTKRASFVRHLLCPSHTDAHTSGGGRRRAGDWPPLGPARMGLATWRLGKKNPDQLGGALS